MSVYYIVKLESFFKKYYTNSQDPTSNQFVSSVRGAFVYPSFEEAKKSLEQDFLKDCMIIDQNGQIQK